MSDKQSEHVWIYSTPRGVHVVRNKLPGDHDSMSPEEIKEWNAFLAKEADEEEQRMLDYD